MLITLLVAIVCIGLGLYFIRKGDILYNQDDDYSEQPTKLDKVLAHQEELEKKLDILISEMDKVKKTDILRQLEELRVITNYQRVTFGKEDADTVQLIKELCEQLEREYRV